MREKIKDGVIVPFHVSSKDQLDDLLRKALAKHQHHKFFKVMGFLIYIQERHEKRGNNK